MFTFGFYDSKGGDRKYDALQISEIFDGIISDGVYDSIGELMAVKPGDGMSVMVGSGRAWFNHTWNKNDGDVRLTLSESDLIMDRYDAVVLEVDRRATNRMNTIKIVEGTPSANPIKPKLLKGDGEVWQHPLGYVRVTKGATSIPASAIENAVGTSACPFVTGVVQTADIDVLFQQWDGEFDEWFENVKAQLTDNVVTNLQYQIDRCVKKSEKATQNEILSGKKDKWVDAASLKTALASDNDPVGTIRLSVENLTEKFGQKWVSLDYAFASDGFVDRDLFDPAIVKEYGHVYGKLGSTYQSARRLAEYSRFMMDIYDFRLPRFYYKANDGQIVFNMSDTAYNRPQNFLSVFQAFYISGFVFIFYKRDTNTPAVMKTDINGKVITDTTIQRSGTTFNRDWIWVYWYPSNNKIVSAVQGNDGVYSVVSLDLFSSSPSVYKIVSGIVSYPICSQTGTVRNGGPFSPIQHGNQALYWAYSRTASPYTIKIAKCLDTSNAWSTITITFDAEPVVGNQQVLWYVLDDKIIVLTTETYQSNSFNYMVYRFDSNTGNRINKVGITPKYANITSVPTVLSRSMTDYFYPVRWLTGDWYYITTGFMTFSNYDQYYKTGAMILYNTATQNFKVISIPMGSYSVVHTLLIDEGNLLLYIPKQSYALDSFLEAGVLNISPELDNTTIHAGPISRVLAYNAFTGKISVNPPISWNANYWQVSSGRLMVDGDAGVFSYKKDLIKLPLVRNGWLKINK